MEDCVAALYLFSPGETHRQDEFVRDSFLIGLGDIGARRVAGLQLAEHDLII